MRLASSLALLLAGCTAATIDAQGDTTTDAPLINATIDRSHPEVALLKLVRGSDHGVYCTGTLIGAHTVLTAGHCVVAPNGDRAVPAGVTVTLDQEPRAVDDIVVHPDYALDLTGAPTKDVAVLTLAGDVEGIAPSLLARTHPIAGESLLLVGYGVTTDSGPIDLAPRSGNNGVSVIAADRYVMFGASGNDSGVCYGDSGGPSFAHRGGQEILAGVHSSASCDRLTYLAGAVDANNTVDLRVDAYLDFIQTSATEPL